MPPTESGEDVETENDQSSSTPVAPENNQLQNLLQEAQETFENANKALENGDLGLYQDLIEQGQNLVQQATELLENN